MDLTTYFTTVAFVIIALVVLLTIIPPATQTINEAISGYINGPDEYDIYLHYRDINNCTKANDSYCINRGGCVHMYMMCQHEQCGVEI